MLVELVELLVVNAEAKLIGKENDITVIIIANNNRKTGMVIAKILSRLTKVVWVRSNLSLFVCKIISSSSQLVD
jgi:hypothetical protein